MKHPAGIIPAAIAQIVISFLIISFAITKIAVLSSYDPAHQPAMSFEVGLETVILCGLVSTFVLLVAVGLVRMRVWARYATLAFAGGLAVTGLALALVFVLMPIPQTTIPESEFVAAKGMLTSFSLALSGLGIFWLRYFSRKRVKAAFLRPAA